MNTEEAQELAPLSRPVVSALYVAELLILGYFVYGAATGKLSLPSKAGISVLAGWQAWVACLFPLSFVLLVALRFDPAISLPAKAKKRAVYICFAIGMISLLAAVVTVR
jgi:hypothetical protein